MRVTWNVSSGKTSPSLQKFDAHGGKSFQEYFRARSTYFTGRKEELLWLSTDTII